MFPSRSSNRSKIKIVHHPIPDHGRRPWLWAGGGVHGAVAAAAPTDRAAMSAYQTSVNNNNKQRHVVLAEMPCHRAIWSNTCTNICSLAYQLYQAVVAANTCSCCEVKMADRPSSEEWRGSAFFGFTQSAVHTDKLRAGLDGMSRAGKNGREKRL